MSNERRFKDVDMPSDIKPVGWYDPLQLMDTASRVTESESFTRNSDRRVNFIEWEGEEVHPISFHLNEEPSKKPDTHNDFYIGSHRKTTNAEGWQSELWVDFLADTGDGGNATYTVAKTLFQDTLSLTYHDNLDINNPIRNAHPKGLSQPLPRADLLILGGDLVYPVANDETYQTRFINFLIAALPNNITLPIKQEEATRAVLSFPQNHDWYDNLSSFFLLFCHKEKKTFFDMKCPQRQSYAAVKLPFDWWLFGFDLALSDDIDEIQYEYFYKIIKNAIKNESFSKKSRVIITYKEPVWTLTALGNSKNPETIKYTQRAYFYEKLEADIEAKTGREIDIRLAGDQHYYRRYSKKELNPQSHLITCGSGGAFLHPTHGPKEFAQINHIKPHSSPEEALFDRTYQFSEESKPPPHTQYEKKCDYPSSQTSWNLSKCNFRFVTINPLFGIITALSYLFLVWANFSSLYSNISKAVFDNGQDPCYVIPIRWFHQGFNLFDNISCSWRLWGWSSILAPVNGVIGLFIIFGFAYFAQKFNSHAKIWAGIIGVLHGLTHFLAIFIIYLFILKYYIIFTYSFILVWILLGVFLGYKVTNKDNKTNAKLLTFENIIGLISYLIILGLFVYQVSIQDLDFKPRDPMISPLDLVPFTITSVLVLTAGYFVGSFIMGGYLFVSLNLYKPNVLITTLILVFTAIWFVFSLWFNDCLMALIPTLLLSFFLIFIFRCRKKLGLESVPFIHSNEAFSSLKIEDYKGFLRFRITNEKLEAFFIGIDQIPKKWEKTNDKNQPKWKEEEDKEATQPKLVDYWTVETPTTPK